MKVNSRELKKLGIVKKVGKNYHVQLPTGVRSVRTSKAAARMVARYVKKINTRRKGRRTRRRRRRR